MLLWNCENMDRAIHAFEFGFERRDLGDRQIFPLQACFDLSEPTVHGAQTIFHERCEEFRRKTEKRKNNCSGRHQHGEYL